MPDVHVFTSAAFNYIPKVRMLFRSLRKHHPDWKLHLVLADELRSHIDLSKEPFDEIHPVSELGIEDWRGWTFCHSIVELATAIKPFMLRQLLARPDCKKAIYLDPDIVVFSPLDEITSALDNSNIVLTPHQTMPEEELPAIMDNEISSLKHGIYNLGFIGVSANELGRCFADWWGNRLYYFCRADIPNGLFTDQRWIDLAPAFFPGIAIMRSSRFNVATWNITTRKLSISQSGEYLVDDAPLGFYHFTGFDSGAHRTMAAKNAGDNAAVQQLINWYTAETQSLARDPLAKEPWAYGRFSDGSTITEVQRVIYRSRVDLQRRFPDPFDSSGYLVWWNTQAKREYPNLRKPAKHDKALAELASILSPGFQGGKETPIRWTNVGAVIKHALSNPKNGAAIGRRGWEILKTEGFTGIIHRIKR